MDASLDEEIRLSKRPTPDWSNLKSMYTAMFKNDPVCHDRFELAQYLVLNDYVNKKNPVKRAEKLVALAQEKERTAPAVREKLSKSFVECKLKFDANVKERQNADKAWQLKHPKLYKRSLARRNARRHVSISNKTPGSAAPPAPSSSSSSASAPKPARPAAPKPVAPRAMDPPAALTSSASLESMKDMVGMLAPKAQMEMNAALLNQWRELQRAISEDVDTFTRHAKELDRRVYGHFHKFLDEQLNQQQ